MSSALLILDMINFLIHPDGTKAEDGFAEQVARRDVLSRTATAISRARGRGVPVIYVVIGFSPGHADFPANSPLFRDPVDRRPMIGEWNSQVHDALRPDPDESIVVKRRVSPFYGTHLDLLLRKQNVDTLMLAGVSTDLVVLSAARDAHDRDYRVKILEDATAARTKKVHDVAMTLIRHTAAVTTVDEALPEDGPGEG
ncbi:cysteine hydrolase family protein [Actinophytocola sp.]|uniref:cysteine hydrolase family protein n=1 Tax=Actinophytocola sp. TaxID=1872138 RepID=UPI003D6A54BA